jgi:murein DD-endopeptidase MepM/ murein hydrolase activator NlpD
MEDPLNSPYSILVLRGAQIRRLVVSQKRLRELLLAFFTLMSICGLLLSEYLEAERQRVEEVSASSRAQREKLSVLHDRAAEVEKVLARWRGLRERIQASLPERKRASAMGRQEGEELQQILAALQGELKRMIAALPSDWPVKGQVTSGIGMRPSPVTGEMEYHAGLDIPKPIGTPVHASGDAVVQSIDEQLGTIVLNHGQEITTQYAHLSKILVRRGDPVRKGQRIAEVGNKGKSTGPHLHYEVRLAGVAIDPRQSLIGVGRSE